MRILCVSEIYGGWICVADVRSERKVIYSGKNSEKRNIVKDKLHDYSEKGSYTMKRKFIL